MIGVRRITITLLGVTFWVLVAIPPAQGRLLGSGYDSGSYPFAFVVSNELPRARSLQVVVSTTPFAPFDHFSSWSVSCTRGFENRRIEYPLTMPGTYTSGPTLSLGICNVWAQASFADFSQHGSISITVTGESKRKPKRKR